MQVGAMSADHKLSSYQKLQDSSKSSEQHSYIKPLNDNSISWSMTMAQINNNMMLQQQNSYMLYENSVKLPQSNPLQHQQQMLMQ